MKFTLDWLKEHLETTASADEIGKALTMIGLEVEGIESQGKALEKFVVAHVVEAKPHPNSDHLNICKVDAGTGELIDVVCGAPNCRTGLKSVFAAPGTYIPGKDFELKGGVVIRGAPSNGMLCSAAELELSNDHDGIIELPEDAPIGEKYVDYVGINGVVFDISITPNRGDATGVYGVARDLAAFGLGTLKKTDMSPVPSKGPSPIPALPHQFAEGEPKAIRKFAGRYFRGIKNGPSPDWLQARLRAVGLRPINTVVDITNLVSLGWGRPLHAYDADKVEGQMVVRNARDEAFDALDNKVYTLDQTMTVIADDKGPLCLGGIMGGIRSGVTDETINVFMECASWDANLIAQAGRKTGIVSDARYRLERNVDPALTEPGLELATRLMLELVGGEAMEPVVSGEDVFANKTVDFPLAEVKRLTGLEVSSSDIEAILARLGFVAEGSGDMRSVKVPSWRPDVTQKADLVEEVMRMVGVDNVPVEPLPRLNHVAQRMLTTIQNRRRIARRALAARGLDEVVTWSFIAHAAAVQFGGGSEDRQLANAIASDMTDMRPSLLPGLLAGARRNANRGFADVALFEVGQIFLSDQPEGQHTSASGVRTGTAKLDGAGRHWSGKTEAVSVWDAKADLAAVLDALGVDIDKVQVLPEAASWSHPGRGGRIALGPKVTLGWFGELHPALAAELDIDGPVAAFEIDLDALPEARKKATKTKPAIALSPFQPVSRDFAFVMDRGVTAAAILKAAKGADKALIKDVGIFDVFEGAHVGEGKKSVAIEVTLQPKDKTLTDEEIEKVSAAVVAAVTKTTGGELRR
ncbi:phenylalanine--tRNA ligase subunit beta [Devosia sp. 63-57]|uniref:phenylalanine--tRNA ligase subunit beta n=1 Tax=Devosia sp. 63-57 TaxID=1895751 RepID=UPI00086CA6BE|nr:phenylalanine--tRNA ligase subunit beta [Devosia sp. 63-57]ODT49369.1 MAG: phenylalanine--tRNA ligase subunit beta [Pelagibacterium sp. SCN 63-126]ODU82545.1 MAG: phenylalanine--tRNA ligase subunit beta [Pelagibacterium sp. SCN 63-17]OJX41967.1 MAG: phenylalanine--tRNA ligase subunit beta [Devosia sp. 63-57]